MRSLVLFSCLFLSASAGAAERPNVLWITSEDNGRHLGCYGDPFADTPNLDALAARGVCFDNAWSNAPVCAPARTTIITGCYATGLGAEHMRSYARPPRWLRFFPQLLRDAGYYCTNNSKTDYNLAPPEGGRIWDASSRKAHWRNRPDGEPFFAVFNFTTTHESQTRKRPHTPVHDPAEVPLPPYWPDTPVVRRGWAQYYDKMTEMDRQVGEVLAQLEADGLAEDTIVFYFSDHGPGMPRCKRSLYESGLGVPMIVAAPDKWRDFAAGLAGAHTDRLVAFVDLAPTVLRIAGVEPPEWMDGRAFLGPAAAAPKGHLFGYRGRMDERYDFNRAVRTDRWLYVRNFLIDRPAGKHNDYMFQTPLTQDWKRLFDAGELDDVRSAFWRDHPAEELFDLQADPDSLTNLADDPAHAETLTQMAALLNDTMRSSGDLGLVPEAELRRRTAEGAEGDLISLGRYDHQRLWQAADSASRVEAFGPGPFVAMLTDDDPGVRYWGAIGLRFRGAAAVNGAVGPLVAMLDDRVASCRIAAGEALAEHADDQTQRRALEVLVRAVEARSDDFYASVMAWNSLDRLDVAIGPFLDRLKDAPLDPSFPEGDPRRGRMKNYLDRVSEKTFDDLAE